MYQQVQTMFLIKRSNSAGEGSTENLDQTINVPLRKKKPTTSNLPAADLPQPSPSPEQTPPSTPPLPECKEIIPLSEEESKVYMCPINMEIFVDPVITKEGYTFEREAIVNWLNKNNTCPLSREPLTVSELVPNRSLKKQIEHYRKIGKLPKLVVKPPTPRRGSGVWSTTGNNSYSSVVNRHEMTISYQNRIQPQTNHYLQTLIDLLNQSTISTGRQAQIIPVNHETIQSSPGALHPSNLVVGGFQPPDQIVRQERQVIPATFNSDPLDTVDIPENPDFSFLQTNEVNMIQSAYTTVSRLNKWDYMRRYNPSIQTGYMFDRDQTMGEITSAIDNNYNGGHSGMSMGYTMRRIQYIAKNGFEKFKEDYCNAN